MQCNTTRSAEQGESVTSVLMVLVRHESHPATPGVFLHVAHAHALRDSLGGAQDGEHHDLLQPFVHVAAGDCEDVNTVRVLLRRQC